MRVVMVVLMMLAAWPAQAQMGGNRRSPAAEEKRGPAKPVIDEKAYKAALERIPEPKEKYDPWSGARPAAPERKPK
jgi:hypothetical protein